MFYDKVGGDIREKMTQFEVIELLDVNSEVLEGFYKIIYPDYGQI